MDNGKKIETTDFSIAIGIIPIVYLLFSSIGLIIVHINYYTSLINFPFLRSSIFCALLGMQGSSISLIRKYYKAQISDSFGSSDIIKIRWDFAWAYFYFTRPILGAVIGALAFLFSFIGFHVLASPGNIEISREGKYLLFALSFLSGHSVSHVLDRIENVSKEIFYASSEKKG